MRGVIGGVADTGVNDPVVDLPAPPRFDVLELRDGVAEEAEEVGTAPPALFTVTVALLVPVLVLLVLLLLLMLTNSMSEEMGVAEVTTAPTKDPAEGLVAGLIFGP
jgi:hypothetical protein